MSIEVLEKKEKNIEQYRDPEHKVNIPKQEKWTVWEFLSNFGIDISKEGSEEASEEMKENKKSEEVKEEKKSEEGSEEMKERKKSEEVKGKKKEQKEWWFFKKLFSRNKKNDEKVENKDWEQKESSFEKENLTKDKKEKPWFFAGLKQIVKNAKKIANDWKTEWKLSWKELKESELNKGTPESKNPDQKLPDEFQNKENSMESVKNETISPIKLLKNVKEIHEESPDTGKSDINVFENKKNPDEEIPENEKSPEKKE